uniref:Urocanate hydratase 1 n=1 Tax=Eptatretus burgeri TaxID=7764 RepID=A0A8C4N6Y6_EPTBU
MSSLKELCAGLPPDHLPENRGRDSSLPHAPVWAPKLTAEDKKVALRNALRYFTPKFHKALAPEFLSELQQYGHIYMYRFCPKIKIRAFPIWEYPCASQQAAAIMHMIMNNLDPHVAQFPQELVTYGGNGQVFSNWAQFLLVMKFLSEMTDEQTLVMCSGHPLGIFPSHRDAPRVVISNGMVIPNYSSREEYERMFALGVTMYGQMTAGSYCYIGPQGIVHGTLLTVLNAGRKYLSLEKLQGKVFVTSGLGGMSGAQAKAAVIAGCVGVIAEVDEAPLLKRYQQGWLMEINSRLGPLHEKHPVNNEMNKSNVECLQERLVHEMEKTGEMLVDFGSDQTSCHNPYKGGYYPVQLDFQECLRVMHCDPQRFRRLVDESLQRQVEAINKLAAHGLFFWDYGNGFLLQAQRAEFRYPSYVQHIMGDIFSLGFGPFRWICTSGCPDDLDTTDKIATDVLKNILKEGVSEPLRKQYQDNLHWIQEAKNHNLVVGSQARILYAEQRGRVALAEAFNKAVAEETIKVSPFRETSNIYDGSAFCADMAVQNVIGDAFRGATWVALHNGGGVGWYVHHVRIITDSLIITS